MQEDVKTESFKTISKQSIARWQSKLLTNSFHQKRHIILLRLCAYVHTTKEKILNMVTSCMLRWWDSNYWEQQSQEVVINAYHTSCSENNFRDHQLCFWSRSNKHRSLISWLENYAEERNRINWSNKLTHLQIPHSSQWNCPFAVCNERNQIKLASTNVKQLPFIKTHNNKK